MGLGAAKKPERRKGNNAVQSRAPLVPLNGKAGLGQKQKRKETKDEPRSLCKQSKKRSSKGKRFGLCKRVRAMQSKAKEKIGPAQA